MRIATGGDINCKNFNFFNAVNITEEFMLAVKNNTPFYLVDPKTKKEDSSQRSNYMVNHRRI